MEYTQEKTLPALMAKMPNWLQTVKHERGWRVWAYAVMTEDGIRGYAQSGSYEWIDIEAESGGQIVLEGQIEWRERLSLPPIINWQKLKDNEIEQSAWDEIEEFINNQSENE